MDCGMRAVTSGRSPVACDVEISIHTTNRESETATEREREKKIQRKREEK